MQPSILKTTQHCFSKPHYQFSLASPVFFTVIGDMVCCPVYLAKSEVFLISCEAQMHWKNVEIHHGWTSNSKLNFSAFKLKALYIFKQHQSYREKNRHVCFIVKNAF